MLPTLWLFGTNLRDLKKSSRQTALIRLFGFVCCNGVQCLWEKTPQPYHKRQLFADRISDNIFTKPTVLLTLWIKIASNLLSQMNFWAKSVTFWKWNTPGSHWHLQTSRLAYLCLGYGAWANSQRSFGCSKLAGPWIHEFRYWYMNLFMNDMSSSEIYHLATVCQTCQTDL